MTQAPTFGSDETDLRGEARHAGTAHGLLQSVRPRQWPKNLLVFVAPAAAGVFAHRGQFLHALGAFAIFCVAASAVYLFNDCVDAGADRQHPVKHRRPVASGQVPVRIALGVGAALGGAAVACSWLLAGWQLTVVVVAYLAISAAYSLRLKREPVIELAAVAAGFVLRAIAGGAATHVPLSSWFLVVTCFGALFVVTGKRVAELRRVGETGGVPRPVLSSYTEAFLQSTLILTATVTVTAYCLWAFDRTGVAARAGGRFVWIELTVVPVILAVLVVLLRLENGGGEAPEDLLLHDRLLQGLAVLWTALFAIGLYG
ncbi:MAG: decaprenyl-phosphate phosphoribosyltransferase [Acidimicrobiales bacterium]